VPIQSCHKSRQNHPYRTNLRVSWGSGRHGAASVGKLDHIYAGAVVIMALPMQRAAVLPELEPFRQVVLCPKIQIADLRALRLKVMRKEMPRGFHVKQRASRGATRTSFYLGSAFSRARTYCAMSGRRQVFKRR